MGKSGITQFLTAHADRNPVSFHMPGHKGSALYKRYGYGDFLEKVMDCDITEIIGADNLFQAEGIIRETAEKYRRLYDVQKSYLLVNGTSGGIIASVLASVPAGRKLIMARNCHKSVFNALSLGHVEPVYAYPQVIDGYGISGPVEAGEIDRLLTENPDAEAVILPSPNYYGICSDIAAIADAVHRHGKILIVDQAHGAHLKFFDRCGRQAAGKEKSAGAELEAEEATPEATPPSELEAEEATPEATPPSEIDGQMPQAWAGTALGTEMPPSAESSGADITINSIHKTLASFTQSAVLNVNSNRVDLYTLEDKLQAVESTSPSYLLMASLDINADLIENHGSELFGIWRDNIDWFYHEAKNVPGIALMEAPGLMDPTKINLDMSACGISGGQLEQLLLEHGIFAELTTGNILMCMTGIGNTREELERLLVVLQTLSQAHFAGTDIREQGGGVPPDAAALLRSDDTLSVGGAPALRADDTLSLGGAPALRSSGKAQGNSEPQTAGAALWAKKRPLHEIPKKRQLLHIDRCEGKICASSLIPYPPGIPFLCPGEEIGAEEIAYIKLLRQSGEKVIGIDEEGRIAVGAV